MCLICEIVAAADKLAAEEVAAGRKNFNDFPFSDIPNEDRGEFGFSKLESFLDKDNSDDFDDDDILELMDNMVVETLKSDINGHSEMLAENLVEYAKDQNTDTLNSIMASIEFINAAETLLRFYEDESND